MGCLNPGALNRGYQQPGHASPIPSLPLPVPAPGFVQIRILCSSAQRAEKSCLTPAESAQVPVWPHSEVSCFWQADVKQQKLTFILLSCASGTLLPTLNIKYIKYYNSRTRRSPTITLILPRVNWGTKRKKFVPGFAVWPSQGLDPTAGWLATSHWVPKLTQTVTAFATGSF